jgi:hypothetical protein
LERVWLPAARDLSLDQLYRALDVLAEHGDPTRPGVPNSGFQLPQALVQQRPLPASIVMGEQGEVLRWIEPECSIPAYAA